MLSAGEEHTPCVRKRKNNGSPAEAILASLYDRGLSVSSASKHYRLRVLSFNKTAIWYVTDTQTHTFPVTHT